MNTFLDNAVLCIHDPFETLTDPADDGKCEFPDCTAEATHGGHSIQVLPTGERGVVSTRVCATHKDFKHSDSADDRE